MNDYSHFAEDANGWDHTRPNGGCMTFAPSSQFYLMVISQSHLSAISQAKAWGDPKKPKLGMAYLLIALVQTVKEERLFRQVAMWVHPCPALLSSLEEAAKKLTLFINIGDDWSYAFVHLCEDSQHVPLSDTEHISIIVDSAPSRSTCRCLNCLEICKLLQYGREVVYPEGLNGSFELIWIPLPKSQARAQSLLMNLLCCK